MPHEEDPNVLGVRAGDPEMVEAINQARATLGQFLENFISPQPNQTGFLLKVVFEESGKREHIWMADLVLNTDPQRESLRMNPAFQAFDTWSGLRFHLLM
jgi:hypothetical protein